MKIYFQFSRCAYPSYLGLISIYRESIHSARRIPDAGWAREISLSVPGELFIPLPGGLLVRSVSCAHPGATFEFINFSFLQRVLRSVKNSGGS